MSIAAANHRYRFGPFELQPGERRLLKQGEALAIGPRALDLLLLLVERSGSLVAKEELLERVWPNVVVEENALQAQISSIRRLIGKDAIATVSGTGYRFIPSVEIIEEPESASGASRTRHNLPQMLTSFIGRDRQLRDLEQALQTSRLVTLTGAGGCGKTRLAIQAATRVLDAYPDGCWFVDLSALTDPASVVHAVANVLGLRGETNVPIRETIAAHLSKRRSLLVVDNVEHLLDASADLVDHILGRSAVAVILATGREPLRIDGELVYRVPSLTVPQAREEQSAESLLDFESTRLFAERVKLHQLNFTFAAQNAPAVASICRRLDGIPLAIELAAARARSMSLSELDRRLDRRFSLLEARHRNALPRHMTLRALIDWSYDLLGTEERALLCRVSVFQGGFDLAAAEEVCVDEVVAPERILNLLTSLVDKSLIYAEQREEFTRFGLLETIRQYANERLKEDVDAERWQRSHQKYFVRIAEAAEPRLTGSEQQQVLDRLELDHDNFRAVLSVCSAELGDVQAGLRVAGAIWRFWYIRGYLSEGRHWCAGLLALPSDEQHDDARAKALNALGVFAFHHGEVEVSEAAWENALKIGRGRDDPQIIATALRNLGGVASVQNEDERAGAIYAEALDLARQSGDLRNTASLLHNLCLLAQRQDAYSPGSIALAIESRNIYQKLGDRHGVGCSTLCLGGALQRRNQRQQALSAFLEAIECFQELNDRTWLAGSIDWLAHMSINTKLVRQAGLFFSAADRVRAEIGAKRRYTFRLHRDEIGPVGDLRRQQFRLGRREGRAMSLEQALAYARGREFVAALAAAESKLD